MPFDVAGALGAGYSAQEIADYLATNPDQAPSGFRVADAIKAGYSPSEIVDHLNPNVARPSEQGVPILAPVQRGIAHASQEAANLAQDLGFPDTAALIRSRIPQGDLAAPQASADLAGQLRAGHIGSALADVPSAALEQFLPAAAGLAGGLLTGGAGPAAALAGRLGGGAAIGAVTQGDAIARQRAANNGEAAPSSADLALGLAGGGAAGALGAVGLGGGGVGIVGAVGAALKHAGADALQPELASLAGSVGTTAGTQNASAADMAASALTGLGIRGALGAPAIAEGVRRVATPAGRADAAADAYGAMTPDQQQQATALAGAAQDVAGAQGDTTGPAPATPQMAAKTAAVRYAARVSDLANTLDKQGVLPDDGVSVIRDATKAALDPNTLLTQGHLDDIGALGLDSTTTDLIGNALQRINTLTAPDLATNSAGPVEGFARGHAASVLGGALGSVSGLHGAVLGALSGNILRPVVAGTLGPVGRMFDNMLGTSNPSLLARGKQAADMLDAAGVKVPSTLDGLQAALQANNDAITTQARLMGLDPAKALSAGLDAAQGDKFKLDYADATAMNRQGDQAANQQRALQVADATALDRQMTQQQNFQRGQDVSSAQAMMQQDMMSRGAPQAQDATLANQQAVQQRSQDIGDATAMDRQRTQAQALQRSQDLQTAQAMMAQDFAARGGSQAQDTTLANQQANTQRAQDVADAQVLDAARTRGMNLQEAAANTVQGMAYRRAMAQKAAAPAPGQAPGPQDANGPLSPVAVAKARTMAANPTGPTATQAALSSLSEPMPGIEGLSKPALVQGELLPDWQYGVGTDVMKALQLRGMPKNLSPAQVSEAAVRSLQDKGAFSKEFGDALMGHSGRVVRGLYNSIRNEALLAHGVDMRTLTAQQATAAPTMQMAAE